MYIKSKNKELVYIFDNPNTDEEVIRELCKMVVEHIRHEKLQITYHDPAPYAV